MIKCQRGKDSVAFITKLLKEVKVSTTLGIAFSSTGKNYIRFSIVLLTAEVPKQQYFLKRKNKRFQSVY